ncbi:hypothetical protein S40288_11641 [Stachybotrys chartarum IBT 40288]|nr:hypothetical protein S40288_11641 [Stachybotrys chartarum IBT 40288]
MRSIFYDDPTKGTLDDIQPYKYFDVFSGAGMGGVLAFLLGRLKLTIPECLLAYRKLSAHVLRDEPGLPLCSIEKLLTVSRSIVEEQRDEMRVRERGWFPPALIEEGSPMIFGFGVSQNKPYCFREHHPLLESGIEVDGNALGISDAFAAMMAAKGLFDAYVASDGTGKRSFQDQSFPYGLSNPALHVLDELSREDNRSVDMVVSIGGGEIADADIPDLVLLAGFGGQLGVNLPLVFPKAVSDSCFNIMSKLIYGDPDTIINRFRSEQKHRQEEIQLGVSDRMPTKIEGYKRFSIGPVENVGPNDYLSVEEVRKASKDYIESNKEAIRAVGRQIRERRDIKPRDTGVRERYGSSAKDRPSPEKTSWKARERE